MQYRNYQHISVTFTSHSVYPLPTNYSFVNRQSTVENQETDLFTEFMQDYATNGVIRHIYLFTEAPQHLALDSLINTIGTVLGTQLGIL